ncbi:30S ribosomal protein THX [Pontibacter ummariensis]
MGKGDKKTKKGKIAKGSYGVRRPKQTSKAKSQDTQEEASK